MKCRIYEGEDKGERLDEGEEDKEVKDKKGEDNKGPG